MSLEHSPACGTDGTCGHTGGATREPDRLIGYAEVGLVTSLSRTTIWRLERAGRFPRRRQISPNRVGWRLGEILAWCSEREAI